MAFDKAVNLLSTLCSGEVHCNQTEYDSWRKGFIKIFLWIKYKTRTDVTDTDGKELLVIPKMRLKA